MFLKIIFNFIEKSYYFFSFRSAFSLLISKLLLKYQLKWFKMMVGQVHLDQNREAGITIYLVKASQ